MAIKISKKVLFTSCLCVGLIVVQAFAHPPRHDDDKPTNLKVLPKDISEDKLDDIMKSFAKSLGVRCGYCHESHIVPGREKPKFDFASDAKPEKDVAREMLKMVMAINADYIAKMGDHNLEEIRCVTCHMGRTKPIVSTDSLGHMAPPPPPAPKKD